MPNHVVFSKTLGEYNVNIAYNSSLGAEIKCISPFCALLRREGGTGGSSAALHCSEKDEKYLMSNDRLHARKWHLILLVYIITCLRSESSENKVLLYAYAINI